MNYYVYILLCGDATYYTGVTNDVERRFKEHQDPRIDTSYTAKRLPLKLECVIHFSNINKAIECEKRIKKWSKAKKKAYIDGKFDLLPALSKKEFLKVEASSTLDKAVQRKTPKKKEQLDRY
jgi:putative endonuclease